jgi:signal peptidase II
MIIIYFPRIPREDWLLRLALALQLGGAVGNLIDRVTQGYVTDFISVGSFPVFNVADASISIGAVLLVISVLLKDREQAASKQTAGNDEPAPVSPRPSPETIPSAQRDETRDD